MTSAEQIQIAADMLHDELRRRGTPVTADVCLHLARRLHDIWHTRIEPLGLPPGEVAQRFRERYLASEASAYRGDRED